MNIALSLAPEFQNAKLQLGDFIRIQIFADEKIGNPGDRWTIEAPAGASWLPSGSLTIALDSPKSLPADGNATKIEIAGLLHQPGPLALGGFVLRNESTNQEITVNESVVTGADTPAPAQAQAKQEEASWYLAPVEFGGWNWPLIVILALVLAAGLFFGGKKLIQKFPGHQRKNLTHTQMALNALANLQKFAKSKKGLQQEEWKKFSFELADILRKYCDANWQIDTSDKTDRELQEELRLHSTAAPFVDQLGGILTTITEVRYGRKELDTSVVPGLLLDARKFVENTTAKPAEGDKS